MPEIEMRHIIAADIALKGIGSIFFILGSSLGAYLLVVTLHSPYFIIDIKIPG
ncbi:hypothetical protein AMTR_s00009p00163260 [Amborella trichopoda]|uniref:Uncharacterized protein n=1 Tax=Amborella trichopoda TaxID=13333 RepID=W1NI62_AMBTC|nr:hypothetical protein AMTR_s00009p00163260 [Amborella trichopoda]